MELAQSAPARKFSLELDHLGYALVLVGLGGFGYLALRDPSIEQALERARESAAQSTGGSRAFPTQPATAPAESDAVGEFFAELQMLNVRVETLAREIESAWLRNDIAALAATAHDPVLIERDVRAWLNGHGRPALPKLEWAHSSNVADANLAAILVHSEIGNVTLVFDPHSVPARLIGFRPEATTWTPR